ncbi:hypothetical protein K435DRAFT_595095, partial [Dendrothele bispora CBS 962.96]
LTTNTNVVGFRSGLTRMQFANSLVLLNLCDMPTSDDMADIIWSNRGMGAFEGLQRLGFDVKPGCETEQVRQAFRAVYNFLDYHLSVKDKEDLGFSPIFVEHLLCKVTRW